MRLKTAKQMSIVAGLVTGIVLTLAAPQADARSDFNRSLNLASRQWQLVEQMTNGTMLAVLGIDAEQNIGAVRSSRDLFSRTLRGLREGDDELGLTVTSQPEVLSELARVEAFWPRYDQVLQTIIASLMTESEVSDRQIRELLDIHMLMIEAVNRTVAVYERFSHGGGTHSILTSTLNGSGRLRTQSQLMLGDLLAIAYRTNDPQKRRLLGEATREFDRTLTGLLQGDAELRLLPAPTDEIRAELAKVQRLWMQIRPILERVAAGGFVDTQSIATVSRYTGEMIAPLDTTSLMYENL